MSRVLICSNFYPPGFLGGAELVAHEQALALARRGHQVMVFAGDFEAPGARYAVSSSPYEGIPVARVRLEPEDFVAERVNYARPEVEREFRGVLDSFRPTVVHFHNLIGLSAGIIELARSAGLATVLTLHDYWGFCFRNTAMRSFGHTCLDYSECASCLPFVEEPSGRQLPISARNGFIARQFEMVDAFVSPSYYVAGVYARAMLPVGRIRVIPNGVDVARFQRVRKTPRDGAVRFTFVGHLSEHKGLTNLIQALPLLAGSPPFVLNLAGPGEFAAVLRAQAASLGVSAHVRFWGRVDHREIERVYQETDVVVLPSVCEENQPVTVTEAMACGIPVAASRIGGIPELVSHCETGYLFEPMDVHALGAAMRAFLHAPDSIEVLGRRAFERIRGNTFDRHAARAERIYGRLRAA